MCRGDLSAVTRILSECLWKGWKWWRGVKETNFLVYRLVYQYRYKQKFYNWLPVFFKKAQAVSNYLYKPKNFYSLPVFFFCYLFVTLWRVSHTYFPYLSGHGLIFFCFLLYLGSYGCCFGLNQNNTRRVPHLLVWWGITRNHTNISLPRFVCEWLQDWTRRLIGDEIINKNQ